MPSAFNLENVNAEKKNIFDRYVIIYLVFILKVLKGSHKCGRIRHSAAGSMQAGADLSRVAALKERCPLIYCEMEPGMHVVKRKTILILFRAQTSLRKSGYWSANLLFALWKV